ncbi:MAG: hypothetical protein GVY22_00515 [Gammaproteobacteria bacterium]|nr:hypothetical protein [Gammaproteobacteria bacterium]
MLRGGSWLVNRVNARADYRNYNHPNLRVDNVGFRMLCGAPIR